MHYLDKFSTLGGLFVLYLSDAEVGSKRQVSGSCCADFSLDLAPMDCITETQPHHYET